MSQLPLIPFQADLAAQSTPIRLVNLELFNQLLPKQSAATQMYLKNLNFKGEQGFAYIPGAKGQIEQIWIGSKNTADMWALGHCPFQLPEGIYQLATDFAESLTDAQLKNLILGFALGAYKFSRYKKLERLPAQLMLPQSIDSKEILALYQASVLTRDLINFPTSDLHPLDLAAVASDLATKYRANFKLIEDDELLDKNYPSIYTVGQASFFPPCLIDFSWGHPKNPKLTLVGKGVCFDSGGLDIKSSSNMLLMKKDMGGAAHALGLAQLIMQLKLPVRLRVLIPAVENVISGNAFKPGDVIKTRKGLTVEVGNTDAEGRLILCDALAEAASDKPDLIIDFATLTGAARSAVGTDISAFFTNRDELAEPLNQAALATQDPIWRLPLYAPYKDLMKSYLADWNNAGNSPYAGAITAALFLEAFVDQVAWIHFDFMAWNLIDRPGRPLGGEAMTIRAMWQFLKDRYHA